MSVWIDDDRVHIDTAGLGKGQPPRTEEAEQAQPESRTETCRDQAQGTPRLCRDTRPDVLLMQPREDRLGEDRNIDAWPVGYLHGLREQAEDLSSAPEGARSARGRRGTSTAPSHRCWPFLPGRAGIGENRMKNKARTPASEKKAVLDLDLDPLTNAHLERLAQVLPIGAFHAAREVLDGRPTDCEQAYVVAVLCAWHREGRYA